MNFMFSADVRMKEHVKLTIYNRERRGAIDYSNQLEYITEPSENETTCISIKIMLCQLIIGVFFLICMGLLSAIGYLSYVLCE